MRSLNNFWTGKFSFYQRHKRGCRIVGILLAVYFIIRLFFTPPLLSDTHFSRVFYDRNGTLLRITLTPDDKYRIFAPLNEISKTLQRATILYEDKYFRYHPGVNPIALLRATKNYFSGAPHPAGASTITMQVARIKYNMDTTRPIGKLIQVLAAIYIDAFYSKDEILQAYLNLAPYGGNIEGIAAASQIYFHKAPVNITTIESITLSTIPQNPTKRGLNTASGIEHMQIMRNDLVRRWTNEYPDDVSSLETLSKMPLAAFGVHDLPFLAPHFINRQISHSNGKTNTTTTLDINLQTKLEKRLRTEIDRRKNIGIKNAAAILVNYKTMQELVHIGSVDYFDKSIYGENDGVTARRSPGSTLKPLIYASATDMGLIHSMTLLKDAKINFGVYAPENADNEFFGPVLARDALTHSRNIPAINLVRQIGTRRFYKTLTDCGVTGLKSPEHYGISVALGGAEVSMYELAGIYATMANLGQYNEIKSDIYAPTKKPTDVLSPEAFFIVLDMLSHQSTPTVKIPFTKNNTSNITHMWKTGTSSSYRDAWTAGIFGDYVLIVWVGNFDGTPNNAFSGAKAAAPIYFALADTIIDYYKSSNTPVQNNNFLRPDMNISQVDMCDTVGGLAGKFCPKTVSAYFIPGKSPIEISSVYRAIPIDNATGLRACSYNPQTTHMAVYEFWDSEYIDMFRRAGIKRNTPPPYVPGCNLNDMDETPDAIIITSPADATRIVITTPGDTAPISFNAICENSTAKIFWFLDDKTIGTTKSGETFRYEIPMGSHIVRAIDESGHGTSNKFSIIK
ncbi:MAG: penicillin-binding protein 1C [Alphaproteobacteria bacterium]|nr:penicillin-binding protein 1C [Alphaproteobacteria bacterium]